MSALDYSENIQFGIGNEQSISNGNETKSKSKSSTYLISGAKIFMNKNKHQSDESRSEQTSSNYINISELLETYKNKVFEAISKTDFERNKLISKLMNKNKPKGDEIATEIVKTYTQKPQSNKIGVSEKKRN